MAPHTAATKPRTCTPQIRALCDLVGRNRLYVGTVAFGPPKESYKVLEAMAAAAKPRSSFMVTGCILLSICT